MKRSLFVTCAFFLTLTFVTSAAADIRIKKTTRMSMPGMPETISNPATGAMSDSFKSPDTTVLIKGPRVLTEMRQRLSTGMGAKSTVMTRIRQCDLGREVSYTNTSKKYTVTNFSSTATAQKTFHGVKAAATQKGGVVTFSITYNDTGERQQMFGYTARRVKSLMSLTPSPDACEKNKMKIETDGWYIDLPGLTCSAFPSPPPSNQDEERRCHDQVQFQVSGQHNPGFAVKETRVMMMDGAPSMTTIEEATEISNTDLDAALFDVPPGYTEDKRDNGSSDATTAQHGTNLTSTPRHQPPDSHTSPSNTNLPAMPTATMPTATSSDTALQPKATGVIRIGITKPKVKMPNDKDDYTAPLQLSTAVRDSLMESLKGEKIEVLQLTSEQPESEAKQKECDYIFYANVTQKRGGGGMFGKMVLGTVGTMAAMMVPGVGGMIASTVGSMVIQQTMTKTAKAKDELTFDYKVTDSNNAVLSQAVTKAKTKQDGEDVLTPQIKQASIIVLGEIAKKK